jgi:hypothetical protein
MTTKDLLINPSNTVDVKVKIMLRPTGSRPVFLGVKPYLRPKTKFLLLSGSCGFVNVGRPLWREDESVIYNCCWLSPAQSFSGPSTAGLMTIFYSLRFETTPTWRARSPYLYPPGTEWSTYTPRYWIPFPSPPTIRKATIEVFETAISTKWYIGIQFVPHRKHIRLCYTAQPAYVV